jgi:hypothetical protein
MGYGAVVSSGGEVVKQFLVVEEGDCGDLRGYAGQGPVVAAATAAQAVPGAVNGEGGDQDYVGAGYRRRAARGLPGLHEPQGSGGTAPPGGKPRTRDQRIRALEGCPVQVTVFQQDGQEDVGAAFPQGIEETMRARLVAH